MNFIRYATLIILGSLAVSCAGDDRMPPTGDRPFNEDWKFYLVADKAEETATAPSAADFDDSLWNEVTLPHTAHIEPLVTVDQWQGICWYRKHFTLGTEEISGKVFLRLDGAMNVADVWVNGIHKTTHAGGFLPVVVDMTDAVAAGENVVAVRLDNYDNPVTGPKPLRLLDFNTYGGLYRNAWLTVKKKLYITDPILENKPASGGIFVTYPSVTADEGQASVRVHLRNESGQPVSASVVNELYREGRLVAKVRSAATKLAAGEDLSVTNEIAVENPALWSPGNPELYDLITKVYSGNRLMDAAQAKIGFRDIEFRGQELYVNGEKTFLRGVNRHQEYPYAGYALSDNAQWRDAVKIKEAGFDYVRFSHYPPSPVFVDACDALGLMVLDAIPGWQYMNDTPEFTEQVVQTARDMIRRDRNHPCILAWEVSLNETWMPETLIDRLIAAAREEYPGDKCITAGWQEYGYDIYLQARQHRLLHYQPSQKPYNVSEYGDWEYNAQNAGLNQDSWQNLRQEERTSRQLREYGEVRMLQQALNIQEAHNENFTLPAHADGYWIMFDYNRGYANDLEASGIMSIDRLPKFSYHFFRSQRNPAENVNVYIASYWNVNSPTDVRVFSNADEVELILNGRTVARQKPDTGRISDNLAHAPFTFNVSHFEEGNLRAIAYVDGIKAAEHTVRTPEAPVHLTLRVDESGIPVAGNDMVFVYAEVKDKNGTVVPDAGGSVEFTVTGNASIVGENPAPVKAGIAFVLVKTTPGAAKAGVSATYHDRENQLLQGSVNININK